MPKKKFPVEGGSCHESKAACESDDKDRDDLIEAGKQLKAAMEAKSSGLGVRAKKPAWKNRYPKGGKT